MSTPTISNTIEGVDELSIKICDITTAYSVADKVFSLGDQAAKITSIHIDLSSYISARMQLENFTLPDDTKVLAFCAPIADILGFIKSHKGGVKSFTWMAKWYYYSKEFTRPLTFWAALYDHAPTLKTLHIGFFYHEPHDSASLLPKIRFPVLTRLRLDAIYEGGSGSSFTNAFLYDCPNLEDLHLSWSECDIDARRMQNVTWSWTFPNLQKLYAHGWNFAPTAYLKFLERHPDVKVRKVFIYGD